MQVRLNEFKVIDKENEGEQKLVDFLTHSIFGGRNSIANLVSEYREEPSISIFITDIIEKKLSESTKEFINYLKKIASVFPDISKLDFTNPIELRKACLLLDTCKIKFKDEFNGLDVKTIATISLVVLAKHCPVNDEDPITLSEISEDDLFTTMNGQKFSLSSLINYHNTRDYRGHKGEQYGSKFLLNPLSNEPFLSDDAERIMLAAARSNITINHLSSSLLPAKHINSALSKFIPQNKVYDNLSKVAKLDYSNSI